MHRSSLTENLVLLLVVRELLEHVQRFANQALADHAQHLGALEDLTPHVERQVFGVNLWDAETGSQEVQKMTRPNKKQDVQKKKHH